MSVEIQFHIVAYLDDLTFAKLGQKHGGTGTFAMCQSLLKVGTSIHKMGFVKPGVVGTCNFITPSVTGSNSTSLESSDL